MKPKLGQYFITEYPGRSSKGRVGRHDGQLVAVSNEYG